VGHAPGHATQRLHRLCLPQLRLARLLPDGGPEDQRRDAQRVDLHPRPGLGLRARVEAHEAPPALAGEERLHEDGADVLRGEQRLLGLREVADVSEHGLASRENLAPPGEAGGLHRDALELRVVELPRHALGHPLEALAAQPLPVGIRLHLEDVDPAHPRRLAEQAEHLGHQRLPRAGARQVRRRARDRLENRVAPGELRLGGQVAGRRRLAGLGHAQTLPRRQNWK
jgi:hypothetical protein